MKTSFWTNLFDFISPRTCSVCGCRLSVSEQALCGSCLLNLPRTDFCASPLDNTMARLYWGRVPIEKAAALFYYEAKSEAARLIYDLKYHDRPDIGVTMGRIAASEFHLYHFFDGIDTLVPVPLTRLRRWQRGYNQSLAIAQGVGQVTGLPVCDKLVGRRTFMQSQTRLTSWQRRQNVEQVFYLRSHSSLDGKHILVIDDVITTGSTTLACMQALQQAGDVRFSVLSLGFVKR